MSKKGCKNISLEKNVKIALEEGCIHILGKNGNFILHIPKDLTVKLQNEQISISGNKGSSLWGSFWTQVVLAINGVSNGFYICLKFEGVGYRCVIHEEYLELCLGYSKPILYRIPNNLIIKCPKPTLLYIWGMSKEIVMQTAAEIRALRKPEPYKGKGILYLFPKKEVLQRKIGKRQ